MLQHRCMEMSTWMRGKVWSSLLQTNLAFVPCSQSSSIRHIPEWSALSSDSFSFIELDLCLSACCKWKLWDDCPYSISRMVKGIKCSQSSITRLAITSETRNPIAVPWNCWYILPLSFRFQEGTRLGQQYYPPEGLSTQQNAHTLKLGEFGCLCNLPLQEVLYMHCKASQKASPPSPTVAKSFTIAFTGVLNW